MMFLSAVHNPKLPSQNRIFDHRGVQIFEVKIFKPQRGSNIQISKHRGVQIFKYHRGIQIFKYHRGVQIIRSQTPYPLVHAAIGMFRIV